ncbi:MAG: choice-of-anchor D domain-containing protein, partial [Verrucomicrobiaceae bacterium]
LTLANCTFRNNLALADGGAIMIEDRKGKVIASNCLFEGNEIPNGYNVTRGKSAGGAIYGNVEATNCKFRSNIVVVEHYFEGADSVGAGGAISGDVKATGCEFSHNQVYAITEVDEVKPTADGGAVAGNFTGIHCVFTGNSAFVIGGPGISSGGALSGKSINAFNCSYVQNRSGIGIAESERNGEETEEGEELPPTVAVAGGGGAVYTSGGGKSQLANSVFVGNTSLFRGGAVQGGIRSAEDSMFIHNCTFLDNGVAADEKGAALSCGGVVRILNNIFWYTDAMTEELDRFNPVHISFEGALRNADENYPTPASAAPNIIKGGDATITESLVADLFLVSPAVLVLTSDPLFTNMVDLDGADNRWGTADDGLRLQAGSPAIGKALDPRVPAGANLLPNDTADLDGDGVLKEKLPTDYKGTMRVQGGFVELGAYEVGNLIPYSEIAVFAGSKELSSGVTRNFGNVQRLKRVEMTFTIKNTGTNQLGKLAFALTGGKEFMVKKVSYDTINPGASATVTVTFRPLKAANYSAKLAILSSDTDERSFNILINGKGVNKKSKKSGTKTKKPKETEEVTAGTGSIPGFFQAPVSASGAVTTVVTGADGEKYLTLTVVKSSSWTGGTVEVSPDLVDWYSGKKHTTVLEDSATLLRVRDNTPVGAGGKRHIRLK